MQTHQFENINILLSTLLVACISAIIFLYKELKRIQEDHKADLKLFDSESKEQNKSLLDILNKLHLSIEEGKLGDAELSKRVERLIDMVEKLIDR